MTQKIMYIKNSYDGNETAVKLKVTSYLANNQIAILLDDAKSGEYYSDLSVFVDAFDGPFYVAIDTNNLPTANKFVDRYKLGRLVGYVCSGFCSYPLYEINIDELRKRDPDGVQKFLDGLK